MESFGYLKDEYNELYQLCLDAEKYLKIDSAVSMLKARQAIEWIVGYLGCYDKDLFININFLEDRNIADSHIIDKFHLIRKNANKSVHNNNDVDSNAVLLALKEVCVWLVLEHDKKNYGPNNFSREEKEFVNKRSPYANSSNKASGFNPLEVVGSFDEEYDYKTDSLQQDVFETDEEFSRRIANMPAINIGYAFFDKSQVDEYSGVVFPLFHFNKNPKIQSCPIAALYFLIKNETRYDSLDGHIKARLKARNKKVYYDYSTLRLVDDKEHDVKLSVISWQQFEYESDSEFYYRLRSRELPVLPVAIARPIGKEYNIQNQTLPFAIKPMVYAASIFNFPRIECILGREYAKKVCSIKSNFIVYSNFTNTLKPVNIRFYCKIGKETIIIKAAGTEFERLEQRADLGNAEAMYRLALCYKTGDGAPKDSRKAYTYFQKAATAGHLDAMYEYAFIADGQGIGWLIEAAEKGHARAQNKLGMCYLNGDCTAKDEAKAFEWFLKAANQGLADAQFNVGICSFEGKGVAPDIRIGRLWLMEAAKQGHKEAQKKLHAFFGTTKYYG